MSTQEPIIDQTEGQVANGTNVTDAPAAAAADAQVTEAAADAQEQPLNAFYVPSATGTCCLFGGFDSAETGSHESPHQIEAQAPYRPSPEEREALATDRLNRDLRALDALIEQNEVQAPNAEPTSVKKPGKGSRQKRRQAPPQVGQWLNAKFERKTERGIIVRTGKARFHVDFQYMALSEDRTAIRFQEGDKVRVRVLSLDRSGGLPLATMLGKMLAPEHKPSTGIQPEVVSHLAGHAVLEQQRNDRPSADAMEEHERFANTVAAAYAQSVELQTEAAAEAEPFMFGELHQPAAAQAEEPEAPAETDPVD